LNAAVIATGDCPIDAANRRAFMSQLAASEALIVVEGAARDHAVEMHDQRAWAGSHERDDSE
jgi:hypothetical protein